MENLKVPTAPVQPKSPAHRKPGDFEPLGATKKPTSDDDPPTESLQLKDEDGSGKK
jgi:hypothetical protein